MNVERHEVESILSRVSRMIAESETRIIARLDRLESAGAAAFARIGSQATIAPNYGWESVDTSTDADDEEIESARILADLEARREAEAKAARREEYNRKMAAIEEEFADLED